MTNQEVISRYRNERHNSRQFTQNYQRYLSYTSKLSDAHGVRVFKAIKIVSILLEILSAFLFCLFVYFDSKDYEGFPYALQGVVHAAQEGDIFFLFTGLFIFFIITRKIFGHIGDKIEMKNLQNYDLYRPASDKLYTEYNSVIGYYHDFEFCRVPCYDVAENGICYCPITGAPVDTRGCNDRCPYRKQFFDNINKSN
ncbi:MAG: hypothetical protein IJ168_10715 [Eubacterium sp.]|nr:hypothetical protein [Eubacterium sp.]